MGKHWTNLQEHEETDTSLFEHKHIDKCNLTETKFLPQVSPQISPRHSHASS